MTWRRRYLVSSYLRSSLWIIPIAALVIEQIFANVIHAVDARIGWSGAGFGLDGAKAVCNSVITLTLSFVVFTFGSLLVAIQIASGQYTPRIIATTLLRDNVIRYTVAVFVFTLLFAIKNLNHIESSVPQLVTVLTGIFGIACLVLFLFLIDYAARMLRPVSLVKRVGDAGLTLLQTVYPELLGNVAEVAPPLDELPAVERVVSHTGSSASIVAVDVDGLIAEAKRAGGVIEFAAQVGDFMGTDEPLFLLRGGTASLDDASLRSFVIFGSERTLEQDPLFVFRILVDIAIKALSAAINDPTTAVLAIDQLHRLLRSAGRRNLRTDFIRGPDGQPRMILRTPDWEDFVNLAFLEIRCYGGSNIQIARRLRAMILNLAKTLPAQRHAALHQELDLLDRATEMHYPLPEDRALARIPDSQGLGGSTDSTVTKWAA